MQQALRIAPYAPETRGVWDAFAASSNNGTLFHAQNFLAYHGPERAAHFRHLLFFRGERLEAVLPMGQSEEGGLRAWRSPYGASYGGFATAASGNPRYADHVELVAALVGYAREQGVKRITIVPPPAVYHANPDASLEFALLKQGFSLKSRDLCQAVDLRAAAGKELLDTYSYGCDKQVRKAQKLGLSVRRTGDWETFHAMLVENRKKHGVAPTHSLADLKSLAAAAPEAMILFGAYRTGEDGAEAMEAGLLAMAVNARVLLNFYTCSREAAAGTGADNLINHEALLWARGRGFHYYDFGTSSLAMEPNPGLIRFKESFGGGSILRDTYEWSDAA